MSITAGSRLKEERQRLGFSQTAFARELDVHRNSLARYESGARQPEENVIARACRLGADERYLRSGERSTAESCYRLAASRLLPSIADRAKLCGDAVLSLLELAAEEEDLRRALQRGSENSCAIAPDWLSLIDALFENGALLAQAFREALETASSNGWRLECGRHAQAVLMIYAVLKEAGKVDRRFLEGVVRLARRAEG